MRFPGWPTVLLISAVILAAGTGYLAATAIGVTGQEPTRTVTVDQSGVTGPTGPAGPAGPPGSPGAESCPPGYSFGAVVFPQQGKGPTQIATCLKN
ncbi:MAG TPA: hypothetical protein VKD72_28890 [Gemmataceae bacterium]|nr:hypothetical protein [Gemmataceae bacterium]